MKKETLRKKNLSSRLAMSNDEYDYKSKKIADRLFILSDFIEKNSILFYMSFKNEVDTACIIDEAIRLHKQILLPVVNKEGKRFDVYCITSLTQTVPGSYGIMEPNRITQKKIDIKKHIDLVILPGIAFDVRGNRIGYGKGYYDRFFYEREKSIIKIALAFESQIVSTVPRYDHDYRVDKIVTESRIIDCHKQKLN